MKFFAPDADPGNGQVSVVGKLCCGFCCQTKPIIDIRIFAETVFENGDVLTHC
jgi:hypothetical protein